MAVGVDDFRFLPSVGTWVLPLKPGLGRSAPPASDEADRKAACLPAADPFGDLLLLDMHMKPQDLPVLESAPPDMSLLDGLFEVTQPIEMKKQTAVTQSCQKEGCQPFFLKPSVATWMQLRLGAEAPPWQVAAQKLSEVTSRGKSVDVEWEADFQSCLPKSAEDATAAAVPIIAVASQKSDGEPLLVFKPPPPPPANLSVGGGNTPKESVVVLEDADFTKPGAESIEKADKKKSSQTLEELVGTRNVDDDEESLLGGDRNEAETPANNSRHLSRRTMDDGVDSASESELGDQAAKNASPAHAVEKKSKDLAGPPPSSTSGESRPVPPLNIKGSTAGSSSSVAPPAVAKAGGAAANSSAPAPRMTPRRMEVTVPKSGASREPHAPEAVIQSRKAHVADGMASQVRSGSVNYVVKVPKNYPGLQYRKSKNLEDRDTRYAKDGEVMAGQVEGDWLRLKGRGGEADVFLPMKVSQNGKTHEVLQPLPPGGQVPGQHQASPPSRQQQPIPTAEIKEDSGSGWFWDFFSGCRCGGLAPDTEVIVGEDHMR
eukprot:TRINITY_DN8492_c0_g1_i1.p1 TRINITY_DN8492_c0_g1~~TRINITY_DN8492_c0_g1_i1.p1  ORF type:complete len:564 (+),score=121.58 TRINITY_DN8492_c0_g1_i1:63-1694(+)